MSNIQTINLGTYANDGTGDDLRTAFEKVNANFAALGVDVISNATNLGAGSPVFAAKISDPLIGDALSFRSIAGSSNITITNDSTTITISAPDSINNLVDDTSPHLGANLNLNTHNVTGTGNINITGSITSSAFYGPLTGNASTVTNGVYTTSSINALADVDTVSIAPTNGQALIWNSGASQWKPGPLSNATWPVINTNGSSGPAAIAIGQNASTGSGTNSIALGTSSSATGNDDIAIGHSAGGTGNGNVSIGYNAGGTGNSKISIGYNAGIGHTGNDTIIIGATSSSTGNSVIVLNATGSALTPINSQSNSFYVAPIRSSNSPSNILYYNTITKEVTYGTITGGGGGGGVTKIIAGTNITITPINGLGEVTINSTGGGFDGNLDFGSFTDPTGINYDFGSF
jgi:hypothetical protein